VRGLSCACDACHAPAVRAKRGSGALVELPVVPRRWDRERWRHFALIVVAVVIFVSVITITYTYNTDKALVAFGASAVLLAVIAVLPRRSRQTRVERAQLQSEIHLARIAELLEQSASPVPPQAAARRRPSRTIVALILFALVVARLGRRGIYNRA
jgi:hypothetical protein